MFQSAVNKLTAWYVAALLVIVVVFSLPIFSVAANRLDRAASRQGDIFRELPGRPLDAEPMEQRMRREAVIDQERSALLQQIIFIDIVIVSAGAVASYFFAKRTLRPIEEAHEAQGRFTADASHELRTPLAIMQSEIEVALKDAQASKADLQATLTSNLEEVERLRVLSDQLLALTKIDSDALQVSSFSMTKAVKKRVTELEKQYGVHIAQDLQPGVMVTGNEHLLMEAVTILISNAVRYSGDTADITVSLGRNKQAVELMVQDNGIGIAPNELDAIFERFSRGSNAPAKSSGHGLGLALAREIARKSGGDITVKSEVGVGSTFTLTLP